MSALNKIFIFILLGISLHSFSQERFRFMFYNVENLFDCFDDSLKNDEEFLPEGGRHWDKHKFQSKINNIYKVVMAVGEWSPPDIIGLCEIENRFVLEQLVRATPLSKVNYQIVHYESPDNRGIDVALLYKANTFKVMVSKPVPVQIQDRPTRDILYVMGETHRKDTLHIFINHWPSRWGGQVNSEDRRVAVAEVLRFHVDSLFSRFEHPNIILSGDFNDHPTDKSLVETLKARTEFTDIQNHELYNVSYYLQEELGQWSHKYQEEMGILDQIIVSGSLLDRSNGIYTSKEKAAVFKAPFLLEKDEQFLGEKTFRTYTGFRYNGGFSDHLPVYMDLFIK